VITNFIHFCKSKGVELDDSNFNYIRRIGLVACYPNLLNLIDERIEVDKEGLIPTKVINELYPNKTTKTAHSLCENYFIMAHPYFRRGLYEEANWAPHFIAMFWGYDHNKIDSYVAVDMDRVRIDMSKSEYMEFDTWYGANFTSEIKDVKDGLVKIRPPMDIDSSTLSFMFKNAYSLDVYWYTKDKIKTVQIAAFSDETISIDVDGENLFPVKYVHAEFDLATNTFRHFDGAIHLYNQDDYLARRDSDFNYNYKGKKLIKSKAKKLFKLNGEVEVKSWIELTAHFFTGNPLIVEYFEGKYPDWLENALNKMRQE